MGHHCAPPTTSNHMLVRSLQRLYVGLSRTQKTAEVLDRIPPPGAKCRSGRAPKRARSRRVFSSLPGAVVASLNRISERLLARWSKAFAWKPICLEAMAELVSYLPPIALDLFPSCA